MNTGNFIFLAPAAILDLSFLSSGKDPEGYFLRIRSVRQHLRIVLVLLRTQMLTCEEPFRAGVLVGGFGLVEFEEESLVHVVKLRIRVLASNWLFWGAGGTYSDLESV